VTKLPQPYISIRKTADGPKVSGQPFCRLGHQIATTSAIPDGIYARWEWLGDGLTVETDRYGFYPLFYSSSDSAIHVSPSVSQLLHLGVSADLDDAALAVFLRFGSFLGNDTAFRDIHALPPGGHLTWTSDSQTLSGTRPEFKSHPISKKEAIDSYIDLFRQSIERRLPSDASFTVPLTGGRDSRHILFELCRAGHKPPFCITSTRYPPARNEDARVAHSLAAELGIPHVVVSPAASRFVDDYECVERTNYSTVGFGLYRALTEYIVDNVTLSFDGIAGDMLSAGLMLTQRRVDLVESGTLNDLFEDICGQTEDGLNLILSDRARRRFSRDLAESRFQQEFKAHLHSGNPLTSFLFYNRTRRFMSALPYALLRDVRVYAPYLDHSLVDFFMSLPVQLVLNKTLHDDVIAAAFPEYRSIPFEDKFQQKDVKTIGHYHRGLRDVIGRVLTDRQVGFLNMKYLWPRWCAYMTMPHLSPNMEWYFDLLPYLLRLATTTNHSC
jgi:asparagine synthase (glutamine-hydrolysing)